MEPFLILLIAGAISLVKWLTERRGPATNKDRGIGPNHPLGRRAAGRGRPTSEEERARRFMEALGIPAGEIPPAIPKTPPAPRQKEPPPAPRQPVFRPAPPPEELPPLLRTEPEGPVYPADPNPWKDLPKAPSPPAPPQPADAPRRTPLSTPVPMPSPRPPMAYKPVRPEPALPLSASDVDQTAPPMRLEPASGQPAPPPAGSLRSILKDKDALRRAVILREVLDPPKGL